MVTFERKIAESVEVFAARIKDPASRPLADACRDPAAVQRSAAVGAQGVSSRADVRPLPLPLRRFLIWVALNWGRQRANFFGTFALSVYSALGAESLRPLFPTPPCSTMASSPPTAAVDVRLNYDHRVMDGAIVARALQSLEKILTQTIVDELAAWRLNV